MHTNCPIRLRAIEPEDLDLLYRIENDRKLWDVGATNVPYSRYTLHDYIATSGDDIYADRQVRMVVETTDGVTVGIADIIRFDPQHERSEVGIVILCEHRRKGYATAALDEMADYARSVLHLHQLYAVVKGDNDGALSLFRKAGYEAGTRLKDWLYDGRSYRDAWLMQRFL